MKSCILDIETESLHPVDGRIICIGVMDVESEEVTVFYKPAEKEMVQDFLDYYKKKGFTEIIGFNIAFDVRYIFGKCLRYELPAREVFSSTFTDLMMILKSVQHKYNFNKPGTLNEWISFLFGEVKSLDGSLIPLLHFQGKTENIIEYCKKDVELTYKLWKRIKLVLENGIEPKGTVTSPCPLGGCDNLADTTNHD